MKAKRKVFDQKVILRRKLHLSGKCDEIMKLLSVMNFKNYEMMNSEEKKFTEEKKFFGEMNSDLKQILNGGLILAGSEFRGK